ncbi:putative 2,3-bisphosphoglycerate-independent phosphoglycerate mutase [Clostridia bacterium]|nr:putative 2,3-bisphosphoglycerate-independent phosphoglycerate mutase [Clostridia bacterium]GHV31594.1 putative 2,3-bisphosphoglycerate-independent phosphoglycerate mutase [Clostridia bacterium]
MKYVVVIGDGMADNRVEQLGCTPLEKADIPTMDWLASRGELGSVRTVPRGLPPGSDTAILSIFGCDPNVCYTGRSPLEAAGAGVKLNAGDVSYRCNIVTLGGEGAFETKSMLSHSGNSVEGETADELLRTLMSDAEFAALCREQRLVIHPTHSFRQIATQGGANLDGFKAFPPHDHPGEVIGDLLPRGNATAEGLARLMKRANELLGGRETANGVWFWAEGRASLLPSFTERFNKTGFVVSAVPLVCGIGRLRGLEPVSVEGATAELDTNYEGKADAVLEGLQSGADFAVVHVEAPDECTHNGDLAGKIEAIERLDRRCIARLKQGLDAIDDYRLLILSDHKTLTATRGHDGEPVPFILYDSRGTDGSGLSYSEANAEKGNYIDEGYRLIERLIV